MDSKDMLKYQEYLERMIKFREKAYNLMLSDENEKYAEVNKQVMNGMLLAQGLLKHLNIVNEKYSDEMVQAHLISLIPDYKA